MNKMKMEINGRAIWHGWGSDFVHAIVKSKHVQTSCDQSHAPCCQKHVPIFSDNAIGHLRLCGRAGATVEERSRDGSFWWRLLSTILDIYDFDIIWDNEDLEKQYNQGCLLLLPCLLIGHLEAKGMTAPVRDNFRSGVHRMKPIVDIADLLLEFQSLLRVGDPWALRSCSLPGGMVGGFVLLA